MQIMAVKRFDQTIFLFGKFGFYGIIKNVKMGKIRKQ